MSYSRQSLAQVSQAIGAITSVNPEAKLAEVMLRDGSSVTIHTDLYAGAVAVTPAVGEQWVIEKGTGGWRLVSQLPFNDPTATIEATEGQHKIGSGRGPVELVGTEVRAHGPLTLHKTKSGNRPSASSVGVGSMMFDVTLGKPIWSNGSEWVDATGTPV